jgi:hypothetical protein
VVAVSRKPAEAARGKVKLESKSHAAAKLVAKLVGKRGKDRLREDLVAGPLRARRPDPRAAVLLPAAAKAATVGEIGDPLTVSSISPRRRNPRAGRSLKRSRFSISNGSRLRRRIRFRSLSTSWRS